jgi:hypothetical protein
MSLINLSLNLETDVALFKPGSYQFTQNFSQALATNAFSYLLFLNASAILADTDLELLLICEVNENISSFGNDLEIWNISIEVLKAN